MHLLVSALLELYLGLSIGMSVTVFKVSINLQSIIPNTIVTTPGFIHRHISYSIHGMNQPTT